MKYELLNTIALLTVAVLIALAYSIRVAFKGQAHFDRVDRQGGSALLSKSLMEAGYWFFQFLARILISIRCSANQLSWCSLVIGVLAGSCLAYGHFGTGAVFSAISAMLDSLDGIVARMTGQACNAGEVLDSAIDRYVEFFFLGGLAIYYRETPAFLALALAAMFGAFMVSYSTAKAEAMKVKPPRGSMRRPERALYLTLGAALSPITISYFEAGRDYPVPVAHPMIIALCLVAVLGNFSALDRFFALTRAVRKREP